LASIIRIKAVERLASAAYLKATTGDFLAPISMT
jgi:hypothetical protein